MNSPEPPLETAAPSDPQTQAANPPSQEERPVISPEPDASMQEYFQLQESLLKVTLIITGVVFISVWIFYSLNIALNYLIGACTGVVYLRMLARNVAQLGRERKQLGSSRLALLIGVIIVASRLNELQIMPIFLGFLTYKVAIIFYMLQTTLLPDSN
ncbi:MAG TPA: ATP synthase subunit I [Coleofasciculaceae cyanobacterium]